MRWPSKLISKPTFIKLPCEVVQSIPPGSVETYIVIISPNGVIQLTPKQESHADTVKRQMEAARKVMRDNAPMLKNLESILWTYEIYREAV